MRIMSLNGWGGTLGMAVADYVSAADPDVLCLQEVIHSPDATREWLEYRDGAHTLPQRANFLIEVASALPGHNVTFCPAAQGDLWDGPTAYPSWWGLATFTRRRLPVIGQHLGFVHKTYSAYGYGEHPRSRTAHVVRLARPCGGTVTIAQMHGLRDPAGKHDTPERRAQAETFASMIRAVAGPEDALVVCGDFNVLPDSETFAVLGELGLSDLVTGRGFTGTRTSHYTKPQRFADYMLVNPKVEVVNFDVVTTPEISDHCPLLLEIT
jgi:endonuclease/exonuclease/phosphatase family metal-dependent hydrolase